MPNARHAQQGSFLGQVQMFASHAQMGGTAPRVLPTHAPYAAEAPRCEGAEPVRASRVQENFLVVGW